MSWKETRVQDQRLLLVKEFASAERSRTEICLSYGVSRKTGYKWYEQYRVHGVGGLADRSRAPATQPHAVGEPTIGAILELRSRHPSWGERKLKAWLERERPERSWPSASTIGEVLKRFGLTRAAPKRRRAQPSSELVAPQEANQVWAIDFKGWFRLGDSSRCEPLTLSDTHTRYLLRCQALEQTKGCFVREFWKGRFASTGCRRGFAPTTARRSPRPVWVGCRG